MSTQQVTVSIENLAPEKGTFLTPLWFGFHDGTFDTYDRGRPVSPGLERLAEDGSTEPISNEFDLAGFGTVQGTIPGLDGTPGPIDPGEIATFSVALDSSDPTSRFFNYASMIIPSNDFFIANGNERLHPIFDEDGNFIGADFIVLGSNVLDAGSEVNDEIPANTAFLGQQNPDTGVVENGVVGLGNGFIPGGNILGDPRFVNADYTTPDYEVARIRVFLEEEATDPVSLSSILNGVQEVPLPTNSAATGSSFLTLNETGNALEYSLTVSGLDFGQLLGTAPQTSDPGDDVTRLHIHNGERGVNGPVAFGLFDLVAPEAGGQDADDLEILANPDGSVTLSGIWEETDPALIPLSQFVSEIRDAEPGEDIGLYWNVHTNRFPGGEIRGQIQVEEVEVNTILGSRDRDTLIGTEGNDLIRGLKESDELFGNGGDDELRGGRGEDLLSGGAGEDTLRGDRGDDFINGGVDSDSLRGGKGDDTFFFGSDLLDDRSDLDVIADFESGDMFDFSEYIAAGGEVSFSSGAFEGRQAIDISLS
ncbi:MAG: spondin domain-containing protein, partial [Geitlerinemataceae cyanobacterium]